MSTIGVLIFDNDPTRDLADKVRAACACYARKFGKAANVCYVHESVPETATITVVSEVRVVVKKWALLHHYQAGREEN